MLCSAKFFSIATALLCVFSGSHVWADVDAIGAGQSIASAIGSLSESKFFPIDATAGAFVRGSVVGEGLSAWMVDPNHRRTRRLANGAGEQQNFMFVVGDRVPPVLEVSGPIDRSFKLQIVSVIPIDKQITTEAILESPMLRSVKRSVESGEGTEHFWQQIRAGGTPLVEFNDVVPPLASSEALVTFLYRGAHRNVRLFGAPSGDHDEMDRLGNSDVWHRSYRVPRTARIAYRLAPDVPVFPGSAWESRRAILATAQRDPLNQQHFPELPVDIYDGFSVVELQEAPKPKWINPNIDTPKGEVQTHRFTSTILGNTRDIYVYRSRDYQPTSLGNALVVTFDGEKYASEMGVPTILDNLRAAGRMPPTAAIMIGNASPKSRSSELPCNNEFARFIAEELMPWVKEQEITATREQTAIVGASFGGLASAFMGLKHPELFGNVFSQSGSFWWSPGSFDSKGKEESEWLTRQFVNAPPHAVRYYLEAGTFEKPSEILPDTRHLRNCLQAKGYEVQYNEFVGGHGYFYWRSSFADGITHLLGYPLRLRASHLPNAIQIHSRVISGGLPEGDTAFKQLVDLGVKTIITVDGAKPDTETAKRHGMQYVHLPHGYDGIPERRAKELAKAVRDFDGPIYIHCHHGKHRSPVAASVACVGAGLIPPTSVSSVLTLAGTNRSYRGLYQSAGAAIRLGDNALNQLDVDYHETAQISAIAEAMVNIEQTHDHLQAIALAGWISPKSHPDLDPAHEALMLREHFTELLRCNEVKQWQESTVQILRDSVTDALELEKQIEKWKSVTGKDFPPVTLTQISKRITANCKNCHQHFRDTPLLEK